MVKKNLLITSITGCGIILAAAPATENVTPLAPAETTHSIWSLLLHCSLFGFLGIVLVVLGFKIFDWLITKIDLEAEVAKGNLAAAVLSAAAILGISIIVAAAIH